KAYVQLPEHIKEFVATMHYRNYSLLIEGKDFCQEGPQLLLAIKSTIPNFDRRQAIRQTWGQMGKVGSLVVKTVFLLGNQYTEEGHPDLKDLLNLETKKHDDLLLWDFHDNLLNLTLKDVLFLRWLEGHCSSVQYIFRGDDDIFINTDALAELIQKVAHRIPHSLFLGHVMSTFAPKDSKKIFYFIPPNFYKRKYPPFVGSGGTLFSREIAKQLYRISRRVLLFPVADIYLGICLSRLRIIPQTYKMFAIHDFDDDDDEKNLCAYKSSLFLHTKSPHHLIKLWKGLRKQGVKCKAMSLLVIVD
uniref:Hexosyltransferase n=1 Tax=Latimeria chalumnae TaxID=7897 RepID=H3ASC8_LATCH